MKITLLLPILALSLASAIQAQENKTPATTQTAPVIDQSTLDKVSYFYGSRMAGEFLENGVDLSIDAFTEGLKDAFAKKKQKYTEQEIEAAMTTFSEVMTKKQQEQQAAASAKNTEAGTKYLADNAKKEGVVTTESGLQYTVVKQGTGAKPKATDTVKVHYEGTLIDGTVFDSSIKRGEPIEFPVNGVIAGWTEALQLMPIGSKYKLVIPAKLAYGERGAGPVIGPNSVLIFDVELLDINK